jgi:hypothetical protein
MSGASKEVTPLPSELFELASEIFSSGRAITRWTPPPVWGTEK